MKKVVLNPKNENEMSFTSLSDSSIIAVLTPSNKVKNVVKIKDYDYRLVTVGDNNIEETKSFASILGITNEYDNCHYNYEFFTFDDRKEMFHWMIEKI